MFSSSQLSQWSHLDYYAVTPLLHPISSAAAFREKLDDPSEVVAYGMATEHIMQYLDHWDASLDQ